MPTTTPFGIDYVKDLIPWMFKTIEDSKAKAFCMIWDATIPYLLQNWLSVIGILIAVILFAFLTYLVTGRWFLLGRVLYTYLHIGIVILFGAIFGPELYANDIFEIANVLIYIVAFITVGSILDNLGIRKYR